MNFVKRSLAGKGTRSGVGALEAVGALLLPVLDYSDAPASSSYSPGMSAAGLMQRFRRIVRDPGAIVKDGSLNVILSNGLANPLSMELLEL